MSTASAQAIPPSGPTIAGGVRMYQSTHGASALNDTDADFTVNAAISMSDSNGRSDGRTESMTVPAGQSATCTWNTGYPTNDPSGATVTITATTIITGPVSDTASQTFTITVP